MGEIKALKNRIYPWQELMDEVSDLEVLMELSEESGNEELSEEIGSNYNSVYEKYKKLSI